MDEPRQEPPEDRTDLKKALSVFYLLFLAVSAPRSWRTYPTNAEHDSSFPGFLVALPLLSGFTSVPAHASPEHRWSRRCRYTCLHFLETGQPLVNPDQEFGFPLFESGAGSLFCLTSVEGDGRHGK